MMKNILQSKIMMAVVLAHELQHCIDVTRNSKLNNFADVLFFFKWLLNGCFCIYSDCTGMDNDYNFYNFISDEANKDLFCLSKDVDKYGISKISFDEGLQLSKELHMNSRSIFNKNK